MPESFFIVLGLTLWVGLAFWPAILAKKKGYNFFVFLLLSLVISFLATLMIAVEIKNKNITAQDIADDAAAEAALRREEGRK